jgi:hypothetical protein
MSWPDLMEESLGEEKPADAEEHSAEIQRTKPVNKHSFRYLIREMWPAYLIEIFVIILGISLTLAMEGWRDSVKESGLEKIYLNNLQTDINSDLINLGQVKGRTEKLLERGNELISLIHHPSANITHQQVSADIRAILDRPKFISSDATFSDLKSSGNLHLLKNIQLKNLLFAYYSQAQYIREVQDAEQQATIILSGSYFLKHFTLDDAVNPAESNKAENINGLLNEVELLNNVLLRVSNRNELYADYQRADSIAIQIRDAISK